MPRRQIQLPGVVQPQPQARPTDQFVQSKVNYPVPKHILDLAKFSPTLTGLITQAQQDAHERAFAQGQVDATFAVPFGSSTADTPEMQANRKAFKQEQANGKILPSEDPHYRVGLYTGEGRRAALTMHAALNSEGNLQSVSRVYDENGDFIPFEQREDPNAIFDRQSAVFLKTPALKSIYGQQAAAQMVEASRAEFVAKVSHLRDKQTQQYHETQLADQTVEQLERVALAAPDQSPEGLARTEEATEGLHDLIAEWTVKWNLPDGPKVARQGFLAFIDQKAQSDPQAAIEAIDLVRKVKVGPTAVGEDNSEDGVAFRAKLHQLEERYDYAIDRTIERENREAAANKVAYLNRVEDGISEGFAAGIDPTAAYDKMLLRIKKEVEPRFRDEATAILKSHYSASLDVMPDDPRAAQTVARMMFEPNGTDDAITWINAQVKSGQIPPTQGLALRRSVDAESAWIKDDSVTSAQGTFDEDIGAMLAGRAPTEAVGKMRTQLTGLRSKMMEAIAGEIRGIAPEERAAALPGITKKALENAQKEMGALFAAVRESAKSLTSEQVALNGKGQSARDKLDAAWDAGVLTDKEWEQRVREDAANTSLEPYVEDAKSVPVMLPKSVQDANLGDWDKLMRRSQNEARKWVEANRGTYDSKNDFDRAYNSWRNKDLYKIIADTAGAPESALGDTSAATEAGGPKIAAARDASLQYEAARALSDALSTNQPEIALPKLKASYKIPESADKSKQLQTPFGLDQFIGAIGTSRVGVQKSRVEMRYTFGELSVNSVIDGGNIFGGRANRTPVPPEIADEYKRVLLATGIASPTELLNGQMTVLKPILVKGGVDPELFGAAAGIARRLAPIGFVTVPLGGDKGVQFDSKLVDPWKTNFFPGGRDEFNAWDAKTPELMRELAGKYGVTEAQFTDWKRIQAQLIASEGK